MNTSLAHLLLVALGGGLGSVARLGVSGLVGGGKLPWGTVTVNIAGSLLLGWLLGRLGPPGEHNQAWHALLAVGFCGGFTTFSSFSWQTFEQLRDGQAGLALLHVLGSVLLCLAATWLGWRLGRI